MSDEERDELRRMTDVLVSHGYDEREAREMLWRGYQGGMGGARAVFGQLEAVPTVGDHDVEF